MVYANCEKLDYTVCVALTGAKLGIRQQKAPSVGRVRSAARWNNVTVGGPMAPSNGTELEEALNHFFV